MKLNEMKYLGIEGLHAIAHQTSPQAANSGKALDSKSPALFVTLRKSRKLPNPRGNIAKSKTLKAGLTFPMSAQYFSQEICRGVLTRDTRPLEQVMHIQLHVSCGALTASLAGTHHNPRTPGTLLQAPQRPETTASKDPKRPRLSFHLREKFSPWAWGVAVKLQLWLVPVGCRSKSTSSKFSEAYSRRTKIHAQIDVREMRGCFARSGILLSVGSERWSFDCAW